ncbi:MAG: DUF1810 family protein [Ruminococcus sp.]|nr:DUF1810 family protein [Ruminococcus sp.]
MIHQMKLQYNPFMLIKNGSKTIELRLNDEKRQLVQVGDFIEFSRFDNPNEKIQTRVTALHRFDSFQELFAALPKEKLGFSPDEILVPNYMDAFYSRKKQQQYGVLGIELRMTQLQKFIDAQDHGYDFGETYETAFKEIRRGEKRSCWMWYVFPQIQGLGISRTTAFFSIRHIEEAKDYYAHPVLNERLIEITNALLDIETNDPMVVFGDPDAYKLRSCMTLFKYAAPENDLFQKVLDKFCCGTEDIKTLEILDL